MGKIVKDVLFIIYLFIYSKIKLIKYIKEQFKNVFKAIVKETNLICVSFYIIKTNYFFIKRYWQMHD